MTLAGRRREWWKLGDPRGSDEGGGSWVTVVGR